MKQREGDEMRHFVIPVRRGKVRKVANIYGPQLRNAIILLPNSPYVYEDRLLRLILLLLKKNLGLLLYMCPVENRLIHILREGGPGKRGHVRTFCRFVKILGVLS